MKAAGFCMLACLAAAVAGGAEQQRDAPSPEDARSMYVRANAMLADAILEELQQWGQGRRDPAAIAANWQPFFHADKVMGQIFGGLHQIR